jgi:PAS domain S-box-containing protein
LLNQLSIVIFSAVVVASLLVVFWRLPMVRDQAQAEQQRAVTMSIAQIEVVLNTIESTADALRQLLIDGKGSANANQLAKLVTHVAGHTSLIGASFILDKDLKVTMVGSQTEPDVNVDTFIGSDMGRSPGVLEARQKGAPVWSDHYKSILQGKPVVALVLPMDQQVLVLELSVTQLVDLIKQSGSVDGLLVLITDRHGEVIASAEAKHYQTRRNLASTSVIHSALNGHPTFDSFDLDNTLYSGRAERISRMGWVVMAAYPKAHTEEAKHATIGIALITLLVSLAAGFALFSALSVSLQKQLQCSLDYAERVAHGNYAPPEGNADTVEIISLNTCLQDMARRIESRELHLKAIVETSPNVAIQWFDIDGRVVDWNSASEQLMGWTKAQAIGKTLADLIYTPAQHQRFIKVLRAVNHSGQPFGPFEEEITNKEGETIHILSTTFAIPSDDAGRRFVCMDVDITAIKRHEHALRLSEQRFNLLFNGSPVAAAVIERQPQGDICTAVNQAFVELTGHDPGGILPAEMVASGLFDDVQSLQHKLRLLGPGKASVQLEGDIALPDGRKRYIEGLAGWIGSSPHDLLIVAVHNVTERHQLQAQLTAINTDLELRVARRTERLSDANQELEQTLQALKLAQTHLVHYEKLAALGSLVAGVAHELNTPIGNGLMVVSTLAQRLKDIQEKLTLGLRRSDLEVFLEQIQTTSDIATRNLTRASELINGFKRVAVDQTSEQRRRFDLADVVHEILLTLQPSMKHKPIEVVVNVPSVNLDSYPGPLGQVVSNLIQNAVVHAFDGPANGTITISASTTGDKIELLVSDNGKGISEADASRIFDPFFTTKLGQGGSGLGLHIVHNIVFGMLGGDIKLRPQNDTGSCFVILIPIQAPLHDGDGAPSVFTI